MKNLYSLALCFLAATAVSFARAAVSGTWKVDDLSLGLLERLLPGLVFGAAMALTAWRYLAALRSAGTATLTPALLGGVLLVHLAAAAALPLTSNDLFSNLAYGRITLLGGNPYLLGPAALPTEDPFAHLVGQRWRDTPIVYGPIAATLAALPARLGHVGRSLLAFKAMLLALSLTSVLIAYRFSRRLPPERATYAFLLFGLSPLLIWEVSAQAHNDGLMVLALCGFVGAALAGEEWAALVCLAAALYSKFAVAPLLLLYVWVVARRSPVRAVLMLIAVAAIGALLFAPYWQGFATLRGPGAALGADAIRTNRSFADLFYWCAKPLGASAQLWSYRLAYGAGIVLLIGLGIRALRQTRTATDVIHHGLLIFLVYDLVAAPYFQPWYLTWLLPLALAHPDHRWQQLVARYTALSTVQYILPIDPVLPVALNLVILRDLRALQWEGTTKSVAYPSLH